MAGIDCHMGHGSIGLLQVRFFLLVLRISYELLICYASMGNSFRGLYDASSRHRAIHYISSFLGGLTILQPMSILSPEVTALLSFGKWHVQF